MSRVERASLVAGCLLVSAAIFPTVILYAGLQQLVAETAVKAGTSTMTYYGTIGLVAYVVAWITGAVVGVRWIFKPAKQPPLGNSN